MLTVLSMAVRNLIEARRRTLILGLALAGVTAALIVVLSLSAGVRQNMTRVVTLIVAGHVNVGGFFKTTASDVTPILTDTPAVEQAVREILPEAVVVQDRGRGFSRIVSDKASIIAAIFGLNAAQEGPLLNELDLAPEYEYRDGGSAAVKGDIRRIAEPRTAIIFAAHAKKLAVGPGDAVTIRAETLRGASNTADVTVVAVARDIGLLTGFRVFVDQSTWRELYGLRDSSSGVIQAYLPNIDDAEAAANRLRLGLKERGYGLMESQSVPFFMKFETVLGEDWTGQRLDVVTWREEAIFLTWVIAAIEGMSLIVLLILSSIVGLGILNTMWIAVRERTREIGTLRAIGMKRGAVLLLFLSEGLLLGVAAAALGAAFGMAFAWGVDAAQIPLKVEAVRGILMSDKLHLAPHWTHFLVSVPAVALLAGVAALPPALRAARLQPVTAMQIAE